MSSEFFELGKDLRYRATLLPVDKTTCQFAWLRWFAPGIPKPKGAPSRGYEIVATERKAMFLNSEDAAEISSRIEASLTGLALQDFHRGQSESIRLVGNA
jgi:hypothetical protein